MFYNGLDSAGSRIYIDGVEQSLALFNGGVGAASASTTFYVGSGYNSGFGGLIDDFRLYSGTVSGTEISALASGDSVATVDAPSALLLGLVALGGIRIRNLKRLSLLISCPPLQR